MIAFMQVTAESGFAAFGPLVGVDVPGMGRTSVGDRFGDRESSPPYLDRLALDQTEITRGENIRYWLTKRLPSTKLCVARCNGLKSEGF